MQPCVTTTSLCPTHTTHITTTTSTLPQPLTSTPYLAQQSLTSPPFPPTLPTPPGPPHHHPLTPPPTPPHPPQSPGYCLAYVMYAAALDNCDAAAGTATVRVFTTSGTDAAPPSCAGASTRATANVSTTCAQLPTALSSQAWARIVDTTCDLGSPLYQVAEFSAPSCASGSSTSWTAVAPTGTCAMWPGTFREYWRFSPGTGGGGLSAGYFRSDEQCSGAPALQWPSLPADGSCVAPTPLDRFVSGLRVRPAAAYGPAPSPTPSVDYLLSFNYGSESSCAAVPFAMTWQFPGCAPANGPAGSTALTCTSGTSGMLNTYVTRDCSGPVSASTPLPFPATCTASGEGASTASACVGRRAGFPAAQPPTSGFLQTRFAGTCAARRNATGYSRYPLGMCVPMGGAYAVFSCQGDGSAVYAKHAVADCSDAPSTSVTPARCTEDLGTGTAIQFACVTPPPPPAPPAGYARKPNLPASGWGGTLPAGGSTALPAPWGYVGSNGGGNPLVLTTALYNPTGAAVTMRAAGGPTCATFPDATYTPGVNTVTSASVDVSLVNMRCVTPEALIVAGRPNFCCVQVTCLAPGGCAYLEVGFTQYEYGGASGAAGVVGGVVGGLVAVAAVAGAAYWGMRRAGWVKPSGGSGGCCGGGRHSKLASGPGPAAAAGDATVNPVVVALPGAAAAVGVPATPAASSLTAPWAAPHVPRGALAADTLRTR